MTKSCKRCGTEKPLSEFSRNAKARDRLQSSRRVCQAASAAAWAKAHPERAREINRDARARDPQRAHAHEARRWRLHSKKRKAKNRAWYLANKDRVTERNRALRKTEEGAAKVLALLHRRRARKAFAEGTHTARELRDLRASYLGKCAYCFDRRATHTDHVVPLVAQGSNEIENLTPACASCNCSKGGRSLLVFIFNRKAA